MIKKILLFLGIFCGLQTVRAQDFPMPSKSDYPNVVASAKQVSDFVPKDWKILGESKGDLNGDQIADAAIAVIGSYSKFINKNENLGVSEFNSNPRMLLVLFGTKDGYRLAERNEGIIAIPSSPAMDEPFESVSIAKGVLNIEQKIFMSAGGWTTSRHIYKFRYQNGEFSLIGADYESLRRNTGETENRSYNFSTGKVQIRTGNISNDKTKTSVRVFKKGKVPTLKTFPTTFEYEVEKDFYL